jgi:multidrug efflux pump subunit AcrA (membrane-fusion protein)
VEVVELRQTEPATPLRLTGTVEPWAEEDVAFEVSGRVTFIEEPGTFLEGRWEEEGLKGGLLARLDDKPYQVALAAAESQVTMKRVNFDLVLPAKVTQAEAQEQRAVKEYQRNLSIREQRPGALSEKELVDSQAEQDAMRAALRQAEAALAAGEAELNKAIATRDQAKLDLVNTELYAPLRGEVTNVLVQAGGYVEAGTPVAHLVSMDPIKVRVSVSAETNRQIRRSDPVRLFLPERDEGVIGNVYQQSTVADPKTRTFSITLICRNHKVWDSEADAELASRLPLIEDLMPATRLDISGGGPLYIEESTLVDGRFVWIAEGINLRDPTREPHGQMTIRKVPVVLGPSRVNYQGIFIALELAEPSPLEFGQACVIGVPEGAKDGDQVAYLPRPWLMQPGSLVEVEFTRDKGVSGLFVPFQAIAPTAPGKGRVFVVRASGSDESNGQALASAVEVTLHESVGELQRIEPVAADAIGEGTQVIVKGANYLKDGEPVSVVRIDRGAL